MASIPRIRPRQERKQQIKDRKGRAHAIHLASLRHMMDSIDLAASQKLEVGVFGPRSLKKIAVYHELGTNTIPPRPFIRPVMNDMWKDVTTKTTEAVLEEAKADFKAKAAAQKQLDVPPMSKYKIRKIMKRLAGVPLQKEMKGRILRHIPPPLKPATVQRKKALGYRLPKTPLYATGKLYKSIKYRIVTMTQAGGDSQDGEVEGD